MDEGFLIKLIGVLKRNIKDKTDRLLAYQELLPFLKSLDINLENARNVCHVWDSKIISDGNNRSKTPNNKNKPIK